MQLEIRWEVQMQELYLIIVKETAISNQKVPAQLTTASWVDEH